MLSELRPPGIDVPAAEDLNPFTNRHKNVTHLSFICNRRQIEFSLGELTLRGPNLSAQEASALHERLAAAAYSAAADGDRLVIRQGAPK